MDGELESFLLNAGLEKYIPIFVREEVRDLETLKALDPNDLAQMGVPVGSRKKILLEINKLNGAATTATLWREDPDENYLYDDEPMVGERMRALSTILREKWEIDFSELKIVKEIGKGAFGTVYLSSWRNSDVVIKQLSNQMLTPMQLEEFRSELRIVMNLRPHKNVVQFLGGCFTPPHLCLVTEYLPMGDLLTFLRSNKNSFTMRNKMSLAFQIAAGMEHLHTEGVLHRDLAARNLLLHIDASGYVVKVSDFGLSKKGSVYSSLNGFGPLKWMAPESLNPKKKIFTPKSDVWSFGVVVWEILTNGRIPWEGLDPMEAAWKILNGEKLQIQQDTPEKFRQVIYSCWDHDCDKRPSFKQLSGDLHTLLGTIRATLADQPDANLLGSNIFEDEPAPESMNRDLPPLPPGSHSAPTIPVTVPQNQAPTPTSKPSNYRGTSHIQSASHASTPLSVLKNASIQIQGGSSPVDALINSNQKDVIGNQKDVTSNRPGAQTDNQRPSPNNRPNKPLPEKRQPYPGAATARRVPAATISSGSAVRSEFLAVPPKKPIPQIPSAFTSPDNEKSKSNIETSPTALRASTNNRPEQESWTSFSKSHTNPPRAGRTGPLTLGSRQSSNSEINTSSTRNNPPPYTTSAPTSPVGSLISSPTSSPMQNSPPTPNSSQSPTGHNLRTTTVTGSRSVGPTRTSESVRGPSASAGTASTNGPYNSLRSAESVRGPSSSAGAAGTTMNRDGKFVKKIGSQWKQLRLSIKPTGGPGSNNTLELVASALSGHGSPSSKGSPNSSVSRPDTTNKMLADLLSLSKMYLMQLAYLARTYFENPIFIHLIGGAPTAAVLFCNMSVFLPVHNVLISQLSVLLDFPTKSVAKFFMKSIAVLMCYVDYADNLVTAKRVWKDKKQETSIKQWLDKMGEDLTEDEDGVDLDDWLDRPIEHIMKEYGDTIEKIWDNCGVVNSVYKGKAWEKECDEMRRAVGMWRELRDNINNKMLGNLVAVNDETEEKRSV
eukprot:TRINITY_DN5782_c0_g1_i1.p1 TRINITY_DN5782_c0_g1~~TRINITY_DN5782_c0_g1_i1.p1  ORF type:complete len:1000 (-),score=161.96 TRINITY_DN5782_c0_g1_i1:26-3025(-)